MIGLIRKTQQLRATTTKLACPIRPMMLQSSIDIFNTNVALVNMQKYYMSEYSDERSGNGSQFSNSTKSYAPKSRNGFNRRNDFSNRDSNQEGGFRNKFTSQVSPSSYQSSRQNDTEFGQQLEDIDFSKEELKPFKKVFLQNAKSERPQEEIAKFLEEKNVQLKSSHSEVPDPFLSWPETQFPKFIMKVIEENKFGELMPIQAASFPTILSGHDLIGIAQTGSGKTLAYVLPALVHLNAQDPVQPGESPIVLVLAPTRELANQIQEQCIKFGQKSQITSVCVFGGAPKPLQEKHLKRGCDIVIATPGRLIDFLEGNVIDLKRVTYVVLDEADRMLDMGFEAPIRKILGQVRPDRQTLMFSATWPKEVRKLALDFCHSDPVHLQIGSMENTISNDIEQVVEVIHKDEKFLRLKEILAGIEKGEKSIIFMSTKKDCEELSQALYEEDIRSVSLHGDKSQRERDNVLDMFKRGRVNTLIATDVASRGLDVKDIKYVINFDLPKQIEDYVHRVGRTGRAGASGKAISFLDKYEDKRIARDLVDTLRHNNQSVSEKLEEIAGFNRRHSQSPSYGNRFSGNGDRKYSNSGKYGNNNSQGGSRYSNRGGDREFQSSQSSKYNSDYKKPSFNREQRQFDAFDSDRMGGDRAQDFFNFSKKD